MTEITLLKLAILYKSANTDSSLFPAIFQLCCYWVFCFHLTPEYLICHLCSACVWIYQLEGSVEYAELNHDCDQQGGHGDHTVPAEHSVDNNMSDHRECDHDTAPDC